MDSTLAAMQIDLSAVHDIKVASSSRRNLEPGSNRKDSSWRAVLNDLIDRTSTDAGITIAFASESQIHRLSEKVSRLRLAMRT
jgi:hypothetical protein